MTGPEQGFLLLTSALGDPARKPLTVARFRELTQKARLMERPNQERELTAADLQAIGCSEAESDQIIRLLSDGDLLKYYVN